MSNVVRSPLFYVGDKYKLIPQLKELFPKNIGRFIEPFTGGGSVFLNVCTGEYLLNDIDYYVYKLHQFLIEQSKEPDRFFHETLEIIKEYGLSRSYIEDIVPDDLKKQWIKTYYAKFNKEGYYKLREHFNKSKEKNILELYLLLIYGFNRLLRFNSKGQFNVPVGNVDFNKNVYNALNDYFKIVKDKNIKLFNLDYVDFLNSIDFEQDDFVYLDPPYLISSSEYNKLWNLEREEELIELLDKLHEKGVKFAVSNIVYHKGKENHVFGQWMKKYNPHPINSNYISYHDNSQKKSIEVLVINY